MSITYHDVEKHLAKCRTCFLSQEHTTSMISKLFMEMETWDTDLPFILGMKNLKVAEFSDDERLSLMLMCFHISHEGLKPVDYGWYSKHPDYKQILNGKEGLLSHGIIRRVGNFSDNPERIGSQKGMCLPTQMTFGKLFRGRKDLLSLEFLSKQAEIVVSSTINKKELYFNEANQEDVDRLFKLMDPSRFGSIMDRLRTKGRKASALCLLYGAPGTGKTELAKQLSLATGRDLVIADAAKLYSSFHGDTEKNVKELFENYNYFQCVSPNAPILLFNEADGFLSKRTDVLRQAIDKIENRVQNILLQALDDFEGIFIATSNLAENIDPAFERRFLFKINIQIPDKLTREKLWLSMIPDLLELEADILSREYVFSGGQIDNVAKKRDIDEALFDKGTTLEEMLNYCDNELMVARGKTATEIIDFNKEFFNHGGTIC